MIASSSAINKRCQSLERSAIALPTSQANAVRRSSPFSYNSACPSSYCSFRSRNSHVNSPFSVSRSRVGAVGRSIAAAAAAAAAAAVTSVPDASVSVVLLAGGVGKRMGASIPKQYIELRGQPIATYSLDMFAQMREVSEIVIVCDPSWRNLFEKRFAALPKNVAFKWALPGTERQDSVFNGLQEISPSSELVAIHDSARPLITPSDASRCFLDGLNVGAAVLGVPVKPTIKEVDADMNVIKTLVRSKLWEVQTPQVISPALLREGFALVKKEGLEVTDDVSIIEAMGRQVKITPGSYTNIKITTPEDLSVGLGFLEEAEAKAAVAAAAANN